MVGDQILHYKIVRQLGAGGMGVVYEAVDTRLGRHVALKLLAERVELSPDVADRFEREAKIASSLNHPNICTVYDVGVHEGRRVLVMELLEGESLRGKIHGQPLPVETILDVGCQIADALDAAHEKGIVHRDVKPANILITKRGQAKLLDFGVAKLAGEVHEPADETRVAAEVLTTPGMAIGSINYMSPEQARGEELDGRTDLFSLGLVLYEMSTGRQAFSGQTTAVVFDAILNRQPSDPKLSNPSLPDDLQRVIQRSLEKDRRMRYQTAADMLAELSRARRDTGIRTGAMTAATPTSGTVAAPAATSTSGTVAQMPATEVRVRKIPAGLIAALGVLVVGLAVGLYLWMGPSAPLPLTEKDTLVVADFANTTNDPVFDDALKQAVAVQLQQTPFVTLLPDQRVQRTLRLMSKNADEPVRGPVARDLCLRAGAKATVEGSISQLGTSYVIALSVNNCQTGESIAQQQAQASSKEEVLKVLGGVVTDVRKRLGESLASIQKYDVPVTEATTSSLEALRAYGLANKTRYSKGDEAAIPFFQKAIEFDPNFALAYAKLGVMQSNIGRTEESAKNAAKAYEYKDRVSEYERLYIIWNYATRVQHDKKLAFDTLQLMTTSYPKDYAARNNLGVYYGGERDFAKALEQYLAANALAPDEPSPIANAAYMLFSLNRMDEGYKMAERALAIRPNPGLVMTAWQSAVANNDPRADTFEKIAATMATPQQMLLSRSASALWRGKFKDYQRLQEELRANARAGENPAPVLASLDAGQKLSMAAYEGGAYLDPLREILKDPKAPPTTKAQITAFLAFSGDMASVRAALVELEKDGKKNQSVWVPAALARAYVLESEGKAREGLAIVEQVIVEFPQSAEMQYHLGHFKEANGDMPGALAAFKAAIDSLPTLGLSPVVPACRIGMAKALLKQGDKAGANAQLDVLLEQWKGADTEFKLLKDVRALRKE